MTALWEEKNEIEVVDNQLSLATTMENQLIELETKIKGLTKVKEQINEKLRDVMGGNNISSYESPSERLKISYSAPGVTQTIDKDKLWLNYPDIFKECVKETTRKGSLRITIREAENE